MEGATIFERAAERRDILKISSLGQETRDLHVRIHAVLQLAIELQKEFVFEKHGRVALFDAKNLGFEKNGLDIFRERFVGRASQLAELSCELDAGPA